MSSMQQLTEITDAMREYFDALAQYFVSAGNPCPSFEDFVERLSYTDILTDAISGQDRAANFVTGALSDTVHKVMAVSREFGMRGKLKSTYYSDAEVDTTLDSETYADLYARYLNYYRGSAPEQVNG